MPGKGGRRLRQSLPWWTPFALVGIAIAFDWIFNRGG